MYLSDVLFTEEGNPDRVRGDLINYKKCMMLADTFKRVKQYQLLGYNFTLVQQIQDRFDGIDPSYSARLTWP